jgi:hypothetical protein
MAEPNRPDPEELARQLRVRMQQGRPRRLRALLITLALLAVPVAVLAWFVWPRPELPRLVVIAYDDADLPGDPGVSEGVRLRARLVPQDPRVPPPDLSGLTVSVEQLSFQPKPGQPSHNKKVTSESDGDVVIPWQVPAEEEIVDFKMAYTDARQKYRTEDHCRLFALKPAAPLLIVDVAALAAGDAEAWRTRNIGQIPPRDGAGKALQQAHTRDYQVVYVAAGADSALVYRKIRGWVETNVQAERLLPDGPVLAHLPGAGASLKPADWPSLARLKERFRGPIAAVAHDPHLAGVFREAGATTFLLSEAAAAGEGLTRLASWDDLPAALPK